MKTNFKPCLLGDILLFQNGKEVVRTEFGTVPVYGSNGRIGVTNTPTFKNALIIGRVGAYCGSTQYCIQEFAATDNTIIASKLSDDVDLKFLFYKLSHYNLNRFAGGSAQPLLTQSTLKGIEVRLPPLPTQRKIAAILGAYDDLIENNTRRIKILEEIAQGLYRKWFVNFRFPGHENTRFVDSQLGRIPEGWEVRTIDDLISYLSRGISPKYSESVANIVLNQKCIREHRVSFQPARCHITTVPVNKQVRFGDILINSTGVGTLGRVAQFYSNRENITVDSHITIARPNNQILIDYLGLTFIEKESYIESLGAGATGQTELRGELVKAITILKPSSQILTNFNMIVQPIRRLVVNLLDKNILLLQCRDLLLPKLISGELDVSELNIQTNGAD